MIRKSWPLPLVAMALLAAACSSDPVPTNPQTTSQVVRDGAIIGSLPEIYVLVVDDADTTEAALLRERVAQSVRASLLAQRELRWGSCHGNDPAEWHKGDIRFVIARPSAPDAIALVTPATVPALAWITLTSAEEEIEAVVAGVTEALGKHLAAPGDAYRPLRAAKSALELVTGARAPMGAAELAFVMSLPSRKLARLLVASTRDDEDAAAVSTYVPSGASQAMTLAPAVVGPFANDSPTCEPSQLGNSRLEAWSKLLADPRAYAYDCDYQGTWDGLLHPGWVDCGPPCEDRPIEVSAAGEAECKILVDQPDLDLCDPARGWRDPGGKPTVVERFGGKLRQCEVAQLAGADLEDCRHSLECSGCASGFCLTEVPELVNQWQCEAPEHAWSLRFVGGARGDYGAYMNVTCVAGGED